MPTMYCEECFTEPTKKKYPFMGEVKAVHYKPTDPLPITGWDDYGPIFEPLPITYRWLCDVCVKAVRERERTET